MQDLFLNAEQGKIRREPATFKRKKVAHIVVRVFICGFGINELDRMGKKKIFGVYSGKANVLFMFERMTKNDKACYCNRQRHKGKELGEFTCCDYMKCIS